MVHPLAENWMALHHVQLAIPPGSKDACRTFYIGILGMTEVPKPSSLAKRGGLWLRTSSVEIHLGVEIDFRPARKAHPSLAVADIDLVDSFLSASRAEVAWEDELPKYRRFCTYDSVDNRIRVFQVTQDT